MNRYRVLLPLLVNGEYEQGDEFDHEFTAEDELWNLDAGLLEIVPREYRVLMGEVNETKEGDTFTDALTIGREALLVNGGFVERVEQKQEPEKPAPRTRKKVNS